jgi:hypothetical protein
MPSYYFIALPFYLYGVLMSMNVYLYHRFFKNEDVKKYRDESA